MNKLKQKVMIGFGAALPVMTLATPAFAAEGDSAVVTAIQSAVTSVTADSTPIIAAAIGLGILWWGAKLLWTKFKSMAK